MPWHHLPTTDLLHHPASWSAPVPAAEEEGGEHEGVTERSADIQRANTHLLHLGLVLSCGEGGGITFLLQVNPHELINGQLAGGCVLKLC